MSTTEKHHFQAEIQQLLDIVIHSLYTDKEIFVRELISNAADACEKLRFTQSSGQPVYQPEIAPAISITTQDDAITFTDTGVGMTHGELVENLGTIAHSGTKAFLKQLAEDKKPDAKLIGQFGVGFYSAFMAANKVTVLSRSAIPDEQGWRWISEGTGGYEIEPAGDLPRGTKITLHLKEDAKDFAKADTIEQIIKRYSGFVQFPIELNGKRLNTIQAIWARSKNEIKEEEYNEFYQYVGHDHDNPLYRLHFTADAPLSIQALLFVPARNFESMGMARTESEVNLYCRKVLIQAKAKGLFPEWLRFLKGVVDSEDLPLNISRETMQDTSLMKKLNQVLTSRFLKFLEEQSEKDTATYEKFYGQFNRFLKEGIVTDFTHKQALGKLLRYESSMLEKGKQTSLADYVKRMGSEQKEIYYLIVPSREAAESSPYFEVFKERKLEVLFLYDPWDEFVMEHLHEFEGKNLGSAEKAELDLTEAKKEGALSDEEAQNLAKWIKETLADRVGEVRASKRLVESPAVIMDSDKFMTSSMRRIMKSMKKDNEEQTPFKQDLEINPSHPIMNRLEKMRHTDTALAGKVVEQVLDNARVAAGLLEDPRTMLKRLNELLEQVLVTKG
ncbi:molecular chaperone HtpG [Pedosphaera parvula]|uniref:Chaperone protein HtpG n=1 Tax=Pedosphaera parvula (strain Ellin514) TaxID=320771 RepID=B9XE68_PEDPL|nr:molecular chaperone HtpG [Pedosphaera parvula]EEF61959.1 heat shock protein Hsp90 [Pedosphaera parvula Ellin514]